MHRYDSSFAQQRAYVGLHLADCLRKHMESYQLAQDLALTSQLIDRLPW